VDQRKEVRRVRIVERAKIKPEDVRAVLIDNVPFHLDCVPKEEWRGLKLEDLLLKEDYDENTGFEFCGKCKVLI
jgi:hypothetical protein